MAVVRELVTKLGFSFDRTNLDRFERSIVGFKTRFVLAATTIGASFSTIIHKASQFSDSILKSDALARFTNSTIEDVKALENAFKKFNVEPAVFQSSFEKLSLGIKEASRGVNSEFRQLVQQSQGAVKLYVDGQLTTTKQAIEDIFAYIKTKADESEQIRIVQNIFGVDIQTATAIKDLFSLTRTEWDSLLDKERQAIGNLDNAKSAARNFKKEINEISVKWDIFLRNAAELTVPTLNKSLGGINLLLNQGKEEGAGSAFDFAGKAIADAVFKFLGYETLTETQNKVYQEDEHFFRRLADEQVSKVNNQNTSQITNTNNINITVPQGTTGEQAAEISQEVNKALNEFWDQKVREVNNNNPTVE